MDEYTIKLQSQYIERIIWITIILILLIALIVVFFKKCPQVSDQGQDQIQDQNLIQEEPEIETSPPESEEPTEVTPEPEPEEEAGLDITGEVTMDLLGLTCEFDTNKDGEGEEYTIMRLRDIDVKITNQKSRSVIVQAMIYLWDSEHEDLKEIPITKGTRPVNVGRIDAGQSYERLFQRAEIPTATRQDPEATNTIKIELYDDKQKELFTLEKSFKTDGGKCRL